MMLWRCLSPSRGNCSPSQGACERSTSKAELSIMLPCLLMGSATSWLLERCCPSWRASASACPLGMLLLPGLWQETSAEPRYLVPEALHRLWGGEEARPRFLQFVSSRQNATPQQQDEGEQAGWKVETGKLQLMNTGRRCAFCQEHFCSVKLLLRLCLRRGSRPRADFQPLKGCLLLLRCSWEALGT